MKFTAKPLLGALMLALMLGLSFGTPAEAQSEYQKAKLEAFVKAAIQVEQVIVRWTPQIKAAQSEQQANELREQARGELMAAVEQTDGITMEEYNQIVQASRNDRVLSARLGKIYEEMRGR